MNPNAQKQGLFRIYQQLFQYKHLIPDAPEMTIDLDQIPPEQIDSQEQTIRSELAGVVAYLLGLKPDALTVTNMIPALQNRYKDDDFWRLLLLDYMDICQAQEEDQLAEQKKQVKAQGISLRQKIMEYQRQRKQLIKNFSKQLDTKQFPINSERLFKNYLNMADIDAKLAWETVTTNPAMFSPIIVEDRNGKRIISISAAKQINKKIGSYIKTMKA